MHWRHIPRNMEGFTRIVVVEISTQAILEPSARPQSENIESKVRGKKVTKASGESITTSRMNHKPLLGAL